FPGSFWLGTEVRACAVRRITVPITQYSVENCTGSTDGALREQFQHVPIRAPGTVADVCTENEYSSAFATLNTCPIIAADSAPARIRSDANGKWSFNGSKREFPSVTPIRWT